ncbi:3-oxoacyl-ACP synthase III family protein [Flavobacterium psychrophilum]|uniref:3-oxoacyl-ACP synthase III family protein n=1 Tax=Flavobacterium psychrophilum TaxID=96345 RepID=UPI000B7C127D|nr:ketoacyl-ACP synthase III [Flavobacterium psychrophilum]MCB5971349.1 ketoacyl-ACP synthase III [Flavobacterium psychrophilum]MCB5977489.1 ketoacyl-ACP synthase III [Flavobacterium psychrophilum]MCB6063296.1 ketoacyl-ACP synthase III [Flavobacterium psychrophilum]MCB6065247.1 ketoacyl-ACP synthase III [Flavobacterium psychrophilum]SNA70459.1 putative 3-oxoacyl-(Acyl-carrier protein) synthase [Flavobacterium psychrophilum]
MNSFINAISVYLPESKLTNENLNNEFPEWSAEKISSKTGIFERRISSDDQFVSDLAIQAALNLFEEHSIDKNTIDFVLLCTQSPDYFLPTTACIIQHKLGLSTNCGALDFNLGCSGFVYGLALANGLIAGGTANNVLLITSETYTKFINREDKSNRTIFGDAAAACLISSGDDSGSIRKFVFGTDGSGAKNLIVKNGAVRFPLCDAINVYSENEFVSNDNNLYMNGQEIFKFTTGSVPVLVQDCLAKNNLSLEDIDLFVFHQANKFMLDYIRRKINIPVDKFFMHFENIGNTVSSTIPIAMSEALKTGKIKKGFKVLVAGFGVGYSYGAAVIEF